jgi:ribonuclease III
MVDGRHDFHPARAGRPSLPVIVVFRTHSDAEASIVSGLLEAHGVPALVSSGVTRGLFPFTAGHGAEIRISVPDGAADDARALIESHTMPGADAGAATPDLATLQHTIGYRFERLELLDQALTHTSRANEDPGGHVADNEALEFLGDAVLGFVAADLLFREFPQFNEGWKSKVKAWLVSTAVLARLADEAGLGAYLRLGRGEERSGGRRKQALLADGYEALIAAIHLDGGIEAARAFVARALAPLIEDVRRRGGSAGHDHKSALQEHLQSRSRPLPEYRLANTSGPDHRKIFEVEVVVDGTSIAAGRGASKKEAEQDAARLALERLASD